MRKSCIIFIIACFLATPAIASNNPIKDFAQSSMGKKTAKYCSIFIAGFYIGWDSAEAYGFMHENVSDAQMRGAATERRPGRYALADLLAATSSKSKPLETDEFGIVIETSYYGPGIALLPESVYTMTLEEIDNSLFILEDTDERYVGFFLIDTYILDVIIEKHEDGSREYQLYDRKTGMLILKSTNT